MEEKKTVFNYISQLFATYGVIVVIFIVFSLVIGNGADKYSALFSYKDAALGIPTLLQLLLLALFITLSQVLFLTDRMIKGMSMVLRYIFFFISIMLVMIIMTVIFKWFPVDDPKAWCGFFISFIISMVISALLTRLAEKSENRKMQEALDKFKSGFDK